METLRAAAREVHLEESYDSSLKLLDASEEVAVERGFPSPTKQLQNRRRSQLNAERDDSSECAVRISPRDTHPENRDEPLQVIQKKVTIVSPGIHSSKDPIPQTTESLMLEVAVAEHEEPKPIIKYSEDVPNRVPPRLQPSRRAQSMDVAPMDFRLSSEQKRQKYFRTIHSVSSKSLIQEERSRKAQDDASPVPKVRPSRVAKLMQKVDHSVASEASIHSYFTTSTQELLFRTMKETVVAQPASKSSVPILRSSVNRLSRPKSAASARSSRDKASTYALLDDQKNCTFRPRTSRRGGDTDEDPESKLSTFIERQEANERARRNELGKLPLCPHA